MSIANRRKYSRIHFPCAAQLYADGRSFSCELIDISLKGVLVSKPLTWHPERQALYCLTIPLQGSDVVLAMDASVAHVQLNWIGLLAVKFHGDSENHLWRLVELNLGDAKLLYRELEQLMRDEAALDH